MPVAFTQVGFRGRNDDGNETTATWKAAANTNWSQKTNTAFRIRFDCSETGSTSSTLAGQLQVQRNALGFNTVNASSLVAKAVAGSQNVNGLSTTQQISSGTFVAGNIDAADGLCATTGTMAQNTHTELEFCVQINDADVTAGDTVQFRVVRSVSTAFGTYTNTPTVNLTVVKAPATATETYTGQSTSLKLTIHPAAGSATFTGQNVTITNNLNTILHPATASATFTGINSALKLTLHPAVASASFTGISSKLTSTLHPAAAAALFGPVSSTLKFTLHPALQTMTFTGAAVSITNVGQGGTSYYYRTLLGVG